MAQPQLQAFGLTELPIIAPGDDLGALLCAALPGHAPRTGDVLVVTSKVVSKAENRFANLRDVLPSDEARALSAKTGHDARLVELILRESAGVSRAARNVLITRHRLGFVSANAAIDHSNTAADPDIVLLMPHNPDASAAALRAQLHAALGVDLPIVIADSHGRPHRLGTIGVAVGVAGLPALEDWRGRLDMFGYALQHTEIGLADMIASTATLLMGQAAEAVPAALIRGLTFTPRDGSAAEMYRSAEFDLYR
jgi:coenzyme F420-0:L-glutamate ligase / coenzyme F420-1:gamma-L-glutamate ligase